MRFSERLKIASFRCFCKDFSRFRETTRWSRNFKGLFSDYVPRNLFFFPCDFENVRRNFIFIGEIRGKVGENQEKVGEGREKFENTSQICQRNDFEPTWKTLVFS